MANNTEDLSLFDKVEKMGIAWDNHCGDLYLPINTQTLELINAYEFKCNVTTFKNAIDGTRWYDVPFAYPGK